MAGVSAMPANLQCERPSRAAQGAWSRYEAGAANRRLDAADGEFPAERRYFEPKDAAPIWTDAVSVCVTALAAVPIGSHLQSHGRPGRLQAVRVERRFRRPGDDGAAGCRARRSRVNAAHSRERPSSELGGWPAAPASVAEAGRVHAGSRGPRPTGLEARPDWRTTTSIGSTRWPSGGPRSPSPAWLTARRSSRPGVSTTGHTEDRHSRGRRRLGQVGGVPIEDASVKRDLTVPSGRRVDGAALLARRPRLLPPARIAPAS